MPTTRRRKIARSVAIRRVKPRKSRNAKRKTYRRKSRNIVMKGGVHQNLKVYIIQKNLGKPKCFIIKKARSGIRLRDDIYLFFDAHLDQAEINEFVCAAMGLESTAHIEPALDIKKSREREAFNNLFIRLRGFKSYSIESGLLSSNQTISEGSFTTHTISGTDTKIENWEEVIKKLEEKSKTKQDYTFDEFDGSLMTSDEITKNQLLSLYNHIEKAIESEIKKKCEKDGIMDDIQSLRRMIQRQSSLVDYIKDEARKMTRGESGKKDKDEHKKDIISKLKQGNPKWDDEILKMTVLIEKIKSSGCRRFITDDSVADRYMVMMYLDGEKKFNSIEQLVDTDYENIYGNWELTRWKLPP